MKKHKDQFYIAAVTETMTKLKIIKKINILDMYILAILKVVLIWQLVMICSENTRTH